MIYLKRSKLIFLKSRKTAGSSFEIALSSFADADDIITPLGPLGGEDEALRKANGGQPPGNYRFSLSDYARITAPELVKSLGRPREHQKFNQHISARDVRRRLGANIFDNSMKVAIVRNPFDALVSRYFWYTRKRRARQDLSAG